MRKRRTRGADGSSISNSPRGLRAIEAGVPGGLPRETPSREADPAAASDGTTESRPPRSSESRSSPFKVQTCSRGLADRSAKRYFGEIASASSGAESEAVCRHDGDASPAPVNFTMRPVRASATYTNPSPPATAITGLACSRGMAMAAATFHVFSRRPRELRTSIFPPAGSGTKSRPSTPTLNP